VKRSNLLLLLLAVALLGFFAWTQYSARREAENKLGLDASRIVSVQFTDRAQVKVGELAGQVTARGTDKGFMGMLSSETVAVLPYAVDYHVDVSGLAAGAYRWDRETRTLTIDVPDVTVGKPNIDEAEARVQQKGVFISRRASQELARQVSQRAEARSAQEAQKPEHLNKARENARAVLTNLAQGPLTAAGIDGVRVAVRFPWEPKGAGNDGEQMDRSRRVEDVLGERNAQTR
jgi:hypothetical protein